MENEIIISNTTDLLRVSAKDVMAIKSAGNYSVVVLTNGDEHVVTYQLGQVENMISKQLGAAAAVFIRVGRCVIINTEYLFVINLPKQQLLMRSPNNKSIELDASRESLRNLKEYVEKRLENE